MFTKDYLLETVYALTSAATPGQSGPKSNEGVLHTL